MRHPRRYVHRGVYFLTFRFDEGLPLLPTPWMNSIIKGFLARALSHFPGLVLSNFIVMGNHIHLIVVCLEGKSVSDFMAYVERELSRAVNRLKGQASRQNISIRYDSPILLDEEALMRKLAYLFLNPVKANLVDKIDDYPGLSSWRAFSEGEEFGEQLWIRAASLSKVPHGSNPNPSDFIKYPEDEDKLFHDLKLDPYLPFKIFYESQFNKEEILKELIDRVRGKEAILRKERTRRVLGRRALLLQSIHHKYKPKKFSKKVYCISSNNDLRASYIKFFKSVWAECKCTYEEWKLANYIPYPEGMFPPGRPPTYVSLVDEALFV